MRNVFIVYMPPGNFEAMVHYEDTIKQRVGHDSIARFVSADLARKLRSIFGPNRIAVWGSRPGPKNQSRFDRMASGDQILIVEGPTVKAIGQIAAKTDNPTLARDLWKPLKGTNSDTWSLIYFIANAREVNVPFEAVARLFGYSPDYQPRGFTSLSDDRLESFYARYDDLYSVLVRLESGQPVLEKQPAAKPLDRVEELVELQPEDVAEALSADLVSDHVRMQFTLARLGLKAGEKVWIPAGDKEKLRRAYGFDSFDPEFASGIDLPHSYVENIDVVWKQEFRIAAAYEIENSTSIYSGLLRFSDLMVLAPNTIYPMFVVAPAHRKSRLRDQLNRPTFKRMDLGSKVRFLSYERIEEIDEFFAAADGGLSVGLIESKAERVA